MAKLKKTKKVEPKAAPAPAPVVQAYQPKTPIDEATRKALYREVEAYWYEEAEHYGWAQERPENVVARLQAILGAPDVEKAREAAQRARNTIQVMILGAWSKGKIPGPTTELGLEKKIASARGLVKMLEAKGQTEAAQSQRDRADRLQEQLEILQENRLDSEAT